MKKTIVIEFFGPSGVGKTTIKEALKEKLDFVDADNYYPKNKFLKIIYFISQMPYIIKGLNKVSSRNIKRQTLSKTLTSLSYIGILEKEKNKIIVRDQGIIHFNKYKYLNNFDLFLKIIEPFFKNNNPIIFYITAPPNEIFKRKQKRRKKNDFGKSLDIYETAVKKGDKVYKNLKKNYKHIYKIDATKTPEENAEIISKIIKQTH